MTTELSTTTAAIDPPPTELDLKVAALIKKQRKKPRTISEQADGDDSDD